MTGSEILIIAIFVVLYILFRGGGGG